MAEVETIGEHAATQARAAAAARAHADEAAASAAGALEAELITARAAAWTNEMKLADRDLADASELSASAGLGGRVEPLADQLRDGSLAAETWGQLLRDLATDWRDVTPPPP